MCCRRSLLYCLASFSFFTFFSIFSTAEAQATSTGTCRAGDPWSVRLGNGNVTINNDFTAGITGSSPDNEYTINISRSRGTITQGNRATSVIVNAVIPRTTDYSVYNIIGADSTGLLTGRAYCNQFGLLTALWLGDSSSTTGLRKTNTTGKCNINGPSQTNVYELPDECLSISPPTAYPSISGTNISLQRGQAGSMVIGRNYTLLPFNVVDCKNCGATSRDGWIEIHTLLNHAETLSDICMSILYLYLAPGPIQLSYLNCFQPQQPNSTFDATYDIQKFNGNSSGTVSVAALNATTSGSGSMTTVTPNSIPSQSSAAEQSTGLATGAKVGIGIAVPLIVLSILAITIILVTRRRRRAENRRGRQATEKTLSGSEMPGDTSFENSNAELDAGLQKQPYLLDGNEKHHHNRSPTANLVTELDVDQEHKLSELPAKAS